MFLIRTDKSFAKEMEAAKDLVGILIETNSIGFPQDARTAHWMAGYYVNSAASRLHALTQMEKTRFYLEPTTLKWLKKRMHPETVNPLPFDDIDAAKEWEATMQGFEQAFADLRKKGTRFQP